MRFFAMSAALLVAVTAPAAIARAEQPVILKMEQFRKSVAFRAEVAGKERLFMFDTGGGVTFLSPEVAKDLGCEKGARIVGFRMTGDRLEAPRCDDVGISIGGHPFTVPVAGIYDVGDFAAQGVKVDGLIALDIFAGRIVTMDFAGQRLILETPESARVRETEGKEFPVRLAREINGRGVAAYVDVPSSLGPLAFELDSGNGGTLLIAKPYAQSFGFDPGKGPQMGKFAVGGGLEAEGLVFPADITLDGNLGMPFLKNYLVTLDLERGRLWLAKNPVAPPPGMGTAPTLPKT